MFEFLDQLPPTLKTWLFAALDASGFVPAWALALLDPLVNVSAVLAVFAGFFALMSVVERKMLARMQNRYGPNRVGPAGILQPVADGIKMLVKEDVVPTGADRALHLLAPVVLIAPATLALSIVPYGRNMTPLALDAGILFFFAVGAATELAIFMAGWASNNKYAILGAMRAIAQMVSYEVPLLLAAIPAAMAAGSLAPDAIVAAQAGAAAGILPNWHVFTPWGAAAFFVFFVAGLVESNRTPFDMPEGESEIVAGHMTEFSGFKYALFFMAEYLGMFAVAGMAVTLFLGGWQAPWPWLGFIPSWAWFAAKFVPLVLTFVWIRGTVPRVRMDQVMALAWKFLFPLGLALLPAAALWHHAGRGPSAWIGSLAIVGLALFALSKAAGFGRKFAPRTYRFAE